MNNVQATAYPKLNDSISDKDLTLNFTPSKKELKAIESIKKPGLRLGFVLNQKVFQRVSYFLPITDIPESIIDHVRECLGILKPVTKKVLSEYDKSRSCKRHQTLIRNEVGVHAFTPKEHNWLLERSIEAAQTNEMELDIINVMCEQLLRHRYELPKESLLKRMAKSAKNRVDSLCHENIYDLLSTENKLLIDELLDKQDNVYSDWYKLKKEPKRFGDRELRAYNQHVDWLSSISETLPKIDIPVAKFRQFSHEAYALNAGDMTKVSMKKRYALATILIKKQHAHALDHVGRYFDKILKKMESTAQKELNNYILERQKETDSLVSTLKNIVTAFSENDGKLKQIDAIAQLISGKADSLIDRCDEHLTFSDSNFLPFMLRTYRSKRSLLYYCLDVINLKPCTDDLSTVSLLALLKKLQNIKVATLTKHRIDTLMPISFDIGWLPERWRKIIISRPSGTNELTFERKYLEMWIFTHIRNELNCGDLHIPNSAEFKDYREDLVNDEILDAESEQYGREVEMPVSDSHAFVSQLKEMLLTTSKRVDGRFGDNEMATFKNGKLSLKKSPARKNNAELEKLDALITSRMPQTNILDVLIESEKWLELTKLFPLLSGREKRIDEPEKRFITTLFCYGCNLGPEQTSKSVTNISAKQVAWLQLRHATEDRLDRAIAKTINEYNKLDLPKYWGDGSSASADGTKWDLYEQNILSEYHIRYGGYGGIGYYHVSDTYIALFSHFIPCGVYEAVHILDGLLKNQSDIQPDTLHGDTQAQSYTVFGLSHLLGINLMPRIRGISDLSFFRADKRYKYKNIDGLFKGSIDFNLIATHLREMLRIVISIKKGKLDSSTILKRLGTYSRKNKLYTAFRELGKVVRTIFLLNYIDSPETRSTIHAATNKSEEFNGFAKWSFFGREGIISENLRSQQTKIIKYNHLVANMIILNNVNTMTRVMRKLVAEGLVIDEDMLRGISPYRMAHINRFGDYVVDVSKAFQPIDYDYRILERSKAVSEH